MTTPYPGSFAERDQWIRAFRPERNRVDPWKPNAYLVEQEPAEPGTIVPVLTVFLANRECPWRCLMCDLWKNTLTETVPLGAIPAQIDHAVDASGILDGPAGVSNHSTPKHLKLYNSGSFFDFKAIPIEDYPAIIQRVRSFQRLVVECHPALVNDRVLRFRDQLRMLEPGPVALELALGLETAHPEVLERLNKHMTLDQFRAATRILTSHDIAMRVFVLVKPPFLDEDQALTWAKRSIDYAFAAGAAVVSLIPTRPGNGALEALAARGEFSRPKLSTLEAAHVYGLELKRGRVLADLWDLERLADCPHCFAARRSRLESMNLHQRIEPAVACTMCGVVNA